jgi:hypothetical protein
MDSETRSSVCVPDRFDSRARIKGKISVIAITATCWMAETIRMPAGGTSSTE